MKIFKEEQKFTQSWIIALMVVSFIAPFAILTNDYAKGKMGGTEYFSTMAFIVFASLLIFIFKLKTRIDEKGITFRFTPFHLKPKFIAWKEIDKAYARNYDPIGEYGGWGIKGGFFWRKSKGVAYNVSGSKGLQIELKNGKKILIGTQKKEELERVLKTYFKNEKQI